MRASRLVALLLLLQHRSRLTAGELARELDVSVRTIYRDVEALGEAGVPVYTERGPAGGVRLVDGYRTRLTGLTADEADSLFLAGAPGPAAQLGLGTVLAAARLKVLAALPPELRSRASRVRERFHLDAPGWFRDEEQLPHLADLAGAVWDQHRVEVVYARGSSGDEGPPVRRRIEPLGLVLKAGVWYLVAAHAGRPLTYRVGRIQEAAVLADEFERPAGFDLAGYWERSAAGFETAMLRVPVTVRVAPEGMMALRGLERAAAVAARASAHPDPDRDGWTRMTIPQESIEIAHAELLRFGEHIEILDPPELRDRREATIRAMAAAIPSIG